MPKFKVKSPITRGSINDKGDLEQKTYEAGDTIELSEEEARAMPHALEKAPRMPKGLPKDVQEAVQSVLDKPEHRDSGVQLDWKVDPDARNAVGKSRQASQVGIQANEAIGAGYERSNEPDETSGEEVEGAGVRASEVPPGVEVKQGEKQDPPKGSAAEDEQTAKKLTEPKVGAVRK